MKTLDIYGDNRFDSYTKIREACRGIVIKDDKILLSYETKTNIYNIPGGGLEHNENYEKCCAREIAEETGFKVEVAQKYLLTNEYYEDWLFISHYFICNGVGTTERKLSAREIKVGMEPRWMPLQDAIEIFSKHQDYAATDEEKRGIYLREYNALRAYVELMLNTAIKPRKQFLFKNKFHK